MSHVGVFRLLHKGFVEREAAIYECHRCGWSPPSKFPPYTLKAGEKYVSETEYYECRRCEE